MKKRVLNIFSEMLMYNIFQSFTHIFFKVRLIGFLND